MTGGASRGAGADRRRETVRAGDFFADEEGAAVSVPGDFLVLPEAPLAGLDFAADTLGAAFVALAGLAAVKLFRTGAALDASVFLVDRAGRTAFVWFRGI